MEHLTRGITEEKITAEPLELEEDLTGETGTVQTLVVTEAAVGQRTDVYLAAALGSTRSSVQHLLEAGLVTRKGKSVAAHYKLRQGDVLSVFIPAPQPLAAQPENIPLDIIYEDEDVVVVSAIVALGHALDMEVVAKGIETPGQRTYAERLRARGSLRRG